MANQNLFQKVTQEQNKITFERKIS